MVPSIKAPSKGGRRTYVLDTNVLLYDPNALFVFQEHELVIPITVIEEIDRFKKDLNETGRNARHVSRHLDAMRAQGSLARGVPLPSGGSLRVDIPTSGNQLPPGFSTDTNDALILNSVLGLAKGAEAGQVIFVTRDTNMRLKADALGIPAEDYEHAHIEFDEGYSGAATLDVEAARVDEIYASGQIPAPGSELYPNQFVILRSVENASKTALARYDQKRAALKLVARPREAMWGRRSMTPLRSPTPLPVES